MSHVSILILYCIVLYTSPKICSHNGDMVREADQRPNPIIPTHFWTNSVDLMTHQETIHSILLKENRCRFFHARSRHVIVR